jgi:hypothetical protein
LASNFSDDPGVERTDDTPVGPVTPAEGASADTAPAAALSPAVERFRSCRWRRPPEDGSECCMHRDVLPMAGTTGFNPDAWCLECQVFKARRAPRKRQERNDYW